MSKPGIDSIHPQSKALTQHSDASFVAKMGQIRYLQARNSSQFKPVI